MIFQMKKKFQILQKKLKGKHSQSYKSLKITQPNLENPHWWSHPQENWYGKEVLQLYRQWASRKKIVAAHLMVIIKKKTKKNINIFF